MLGLVAKVKTLREYWVDWWSDFLETVDEVCRQNSIPQVLAVVVLAAMITLAQLVLWGLLSLLIALPVWGLWNVVMPDLGVPNIGYVNAYCLTLLCAILFRGNSVHLKEE